MSNHLDLVKSPGLNEWALMKEQAVMFINSGFLPDSIKKPEQAIVIMLKGRELGMPPMQSFQHISVIKGKPTMSAEGMLAQIFKCYPGTKLKYLQNDDEACVLEVQKPGNDKNTFKFSYDDAKKAKLTGKDNWNTYRRAMLRSRCVSEMARAVFPDALMGVSYTPEEIEDTAPIDATSKEPKQIPTKPELVLQQFTALFASLGKSSVNIRSWLEEIANGGIRKLDEFKDDDFTVLRNVYGKLRNKELTFEELTMPAAPQIIEVEQELEMPSQPEKVEDILM